MPVSVIVAAAGLACIGDNSPFFVSGPAVEANFQPTLTILSPTASDSLSVGERLLITWSDSDPDSSATIRFDLISTTTGNLYNLVSGIAENDETDSWSADTEVVPIGSYNLRGQITDGISVRDVFAISDPATSARVLITIAGEGTTPANEPPRLDVYEPQFNQSVSQDDTLVVAIRPVDFDPNTVDPNQGDPGEIPYDPDNDVTVLILLDLDSDSTNDDPFNPDPNELILLRSLTIAQGESGDQTFNIPIDLGLVPTRENGEPYFIRATISDSTNPPLNVYADGTINVVQAAQGDFVDMGQIGTLISGVAFYGFGPEAQLGANIQGVGDFDEDGVADFVMISQFGNPRNRGPVGEAYLIYGQDARRFGGRISANSTSTLVPGAIFDAGPLRCGDFALCSGVTTPVSYGLTSVAAIGDLDGDGRNELLFGLPHVDGVWQGRDDDPGNDPPEGSETTPIAITVRQGQRTIQVGDGAISTASYTEAEDTYIDSAAAAANFGSSSDLVWRNDGVGDSAFTLLKFSNILDEIPDDAGLIIGLSASLRIRIVNPGGSGTLHTLFTDFDEAEVTYNSFGGGGGPVVDVDYAEEELGTVNGETVGDFTEVDVTTLVQALVDGQLDDIDNELRFIIVPGDDDMAADEVTFRSSEYGAVTDQRPTLIINYERAISAGGFGCYPDGFVNNLATRDDPDDSTIEALGMAVMVSSRNRDSSGLVNPDRMESTTVELEHVGQQSDLRPGDIIVVATTGNAQVGPLEGGRTAGARFQSGWYDLIDHELLNQPPLNDRFGWTVSSISDLDNDQLPEIIISAPTNERDVMQTEENFGSFSTHMLSRGYTGSVIVLPGFDYNDDFWRDKDGAALGNASIPAPIGVTLGADSVKQAGNCSTPDSRFGPATPSDSFEIFAESVDDFMGGAQSAGDFNLDGPPDFVLGAPGNDEDDLVDQGALYILYGRTPTGDFDLRENAADIPALRPPMLRVFGQTHNDQVGGELIRGDVRTPVKAGYVRQMSGEDVNGDRIGDVIFGAPRADFGDVTQTSCTGDFDQNGILDDDDLSLDAFDGCIADFGNEVFADDPCKAFDFDNDRQITEDATRNYDEDSLILNDRDVLLCLLTGSTECCPVDNGFVGVIFGGTTTNGDRILNQIGTTDLPGTRFYGANPGDRAGMDIASAGDFNQDGFGDILIAAPGVETLDSAGQTRVGVVYLIFGGLHLYNREFSLAAVGSLELPGITFMSPYVSGRPNEAPPDHVGAVGDINNDGFADIAIGITDADFLDENLPQDPGGANNDPDVGRIVDTGEAYIIYGNNFGSNTLP